MLPPNKCTIPELRSWFIKGVLCQNGNAQIEWATPLRWIKYPTGLKGIFGCARVTAPGYAPKSYLVTWDSGSGKRAK